MKLSDLVAAAGVRPILIDGNAEIASICQDSRQATPGALFAFELVQGPAGGLLLRATPVSAGLGTATANALTRADIIERLRLGEATVFAQSFDRPNISYTIVQRNQGQKQLLQFLARHKGESGIVYCLSRAKVDRTAEVSPWEFLMPAPYKV